EEDRRRTEEQHVIVACADKSVQRDQAVAAGAVLDDDRLAPTRAQPIGEQSRGNVGRAGGAGWKNETNRACRVGRLGRETSHLRQASHLRHGGERERGDDEHSSHRSSITWSLDGARIKHNRTADRCQLKRSLLRHHELERLPGDAVRFDARWIAVAAAIAAVHREENSARAISWQDIVLWHLLTEDEARAAVRARDQD